MMSLNLGGEWEEEELTETGNLTLVPFDVFVEVSLSHLPPYRRNRYSITHCP
jgi:hypothetical protein